VNVVVIDSLPAHTSFVDATVSAGTVLVEGTMVTASFGTLSFDAFATLTLTVRVDQDTPRGTIISNTADGTSSTPDNEPSNNSATAITGVTGPFSGDVLISEFRFSGPAGAFDEFIELYNNTDAPLAVSTTDQSSGWAVAASDGIIRFTIPNGTVIPARGHFLGVNAGNPAPPSILLRSSVENGAVQLGDATYVSGIPNDTGIALFRTANTGNFSVATRLDAVGSTAEANTLYKEGTGYPAIGANLTLDYSFVRDQCGKGGSTSVFGPCPTNGRPKDTDNNATDFIFVDTNGTNAGAGQRLGAAGPEALVDPITANDFAVFNNLDRTAGASASPNRVRDFTSDPANNSNFGTLELRRRIVNNAGFPITRLRYRIIDISTFPAPVGVADLRARTSGDISVGGINDDLTCPGGSTPCTVTVNGTTLEQPPSQPNGGGFNSSMSSNTITLATPLPAGESINVRFLLGIQQTGSFKFFVNVELITDQSEPVGEESGTTSQKLVRGQQRAAGTAQPTSTSQPTVSTRKPVVELSPAAQFRIVPILNLNTPRDEATTKKKSEKKKKKGNGSKQQRSLPNAN
jgi:hypothetical protein